MAFQFIDASRRRHLEAARGAGLPRQTSVPETLKSWFRGVLARAPPSCHPVAPDAVLQALADCGAVYGSDLQGLTADELRGVWPPLRELTGEFLRAIVWQPEVRARRAASGPAPSGEDAAEHAHSPKKQKSGHAHSTASSPSPVTISAPAAAEVSAAVNVLVQARAGGMAPPSEALACAISVVCRAQGPVWPEGPSESALPSARANWLAQATAQQRERLLHGRVLLQELENWRQSGPSYASAVRLWGRLATATGVPEWPPDQTVLAALVFAVPRASTLSRYCSHVRSVLRLLRAPLGALADTGALVKGAQKSCTSRPRFKASASGKQVRELADYARRALSDPELADSWVVARHFTLRYGCEVLKLGSDPSHSEVWCSVREGVREATIVFHRRKMQNKPVHVVRQCVCKAPAPDLCGVCVIRRRRGRGPLFPALQYDRALAALKTAALALGFPRGAEWGTHCFRRGWANDALRHGGVPALFYSGGWRGIAAFGYASAQAQGEVLAAKWAAEFSESSDDEPGVEV